MKYEFDFQIDEKTLYDFYVSHNLGGIAGILWPVLGVLAIVVAIISGDTTPVLYRIVYAVFGFLFLFYIPFDLKRKAKKQVEKNPVYAKPIHYVLDEDGVTTSQGENEAKVTWNDFVKMKLTKKSLILYMRNKNACVFSKEIFGEDFDKAHEWMKKKIGK